MTAPLHSVESRLAAFGLTPVVAAEIECYVVLEGDIESFWRPVDAILRDVGVSLVRIEKERGEHQFELVTHVTTPARLVEWLNAIKTIIAEQGRERGAAVSFAAKPYADQPSSGLHLHLHLADHEGINAFHKTDEWISDALRFSLGGLLATLPSAMEIFFPDAASYARLEDIDHVPKIASWGMNNRYCALRIPANPDPYSKHIEHRVPCANADPYLSIAAMLEGVAIGLENKIEPPPQEHGKPTIGLLESMTNAPVELPTSCDTLRSHPASRP